MGATVLGHCETDGEPGDAPERTCAVTRAKLAPEDLIRFVRSPDGSIVPDVACRLPGRGVWVACDRDTVADAVRRNAFARSLKRPVTVPPELPALVERLLRERVAGALAMARKAGALTTGFTKVDVAIAKGEVAVLVHASDAADDGRSKLDRKFRAVAADLNGTNPPAIVDELTIEELSLAIGRSHVVHAALARGGAAHNLIKEAGRLRRYRGKRIGEAARPPASGSDTEQA